MKSVLLQRSCSFLVGLMLSCGTVVTGLTAAGWAETAAAAPHGRAVEVEATAYSPQDPGLSNRTATGTRLRKGVIAVDPDFIPLGSRVYIPDYGEAVAEDVGGAIVGNIIDVAFDTHAEALEFGRQYIVIYLLDEEEEEPVAAETEEDNDKAAEADGEVTVAEADEDEAEETESGTAEEDDEEKSAAPAEDEEEPEESTEE